jgi:uncharacterized membrane protein YcaP (DUF421 family)
MDSVTFVFAGWEQAARVVFVGTLAYFSLVLLIRASTKRTLAQLSAFDFVITVALGSAYGRILTATEVGLFEAILAFALLAGLQVALAAAESRWPRFAQLVKAPPSLLYYQGEFLHDTLRKERIAPSEIEAAVRAKGLGSFEEVEAVVLESGGSFSIIQSPQVGTGSIIPR